MPTATKHDHEKLANEVKSKSNTLVHQLTAHPYSDQKVRSAVTAMRGTLDKITPRKQRWGLGTGLFIGFICGLGIWYLVAHNIIMIPR